MKKYYAPENPPKPRLKSSKNPPCADNRKLLPRLRIEISLNSYPILTAGFADGRVKGVESLSLSSYMRPEPPLHIAAGGYGEENLDMVRLLVARGANVNAKGSRSRNTALHVAAEHNHAETVRFLVEHGANIEAKDHIDETPLLAAADSSDAGIEVAEAAECLLALGAKLNVTNWHGQTPIMAAASRGRVKTVRILVKHGADPSGLNEHTKDLWDGVRSSEDIEFLLKHTNSKDVDVAAAYNSVAWLYATCPNTNSYKPSEAVQLAQKAVTLERKDMYLDTLAVAHAASGNFAQAIKVQEEAIKLTTNAWHLKEWQARVEGYRRGKTYREQRDKDPLK